MVGGHTMLAVLTMFGMMAFEATSELVPMTGSVGLVSTDRSSVSLVSLNFLLPFLQAFIFMFLTTVFIGQMSQS